MEGRRLILNDGTIIEGGNAGLSSAHNLWMWFTGFTMMQAAAIFFNPQNTAKIVFQYGEMEVEYEGYTNCTSISIDMDGKVSVCMVQEVESNV